MIGTLFPPVLGLGVVLSEDELDAKGNKEAIYKKMVLCNEYFYTDLTEE